MSVLRFYNYFAAAYGTCWLVLSFPAFFGRAFHISQDGFYGFVAVSVAYAIVRMVNNIISRLHAAQQFSEFD